LAAPRKIKEWLWLSQAEPSSAHVQVEGNWLSGAKPWVAIKDGTLARQIAEVAQKFQRILRS
jgi:hypothetical protein